MLRKLLGVSVRRQAGLVRTRGIRLQPAAAGGMGCWYGGRRWLTTEPAATTGEDISSSSNSSSSSSPPLIPPVKLGSFLTKYGVNLTKQASDGRLDPVIGRDNEIDRSIQVLSRRTKNNPILLGDPGVGKTAIAEGLARRIVLGQVPSSMLDKVIISLDLASMLAGARFRGEFEERLKGVLNDIEKAGDRVILFIDEIHVLVGAGGAEGAIDAGNIMKPQLARGQLRCMGATTTAEFKYIEKDAALARRFQTIVVPEPTVEDSILMLSGLRPKYESHHVIRITDKALEAAAKLSHRYITSRRLPDKAIDLVDEAASMLRMRLEAPPPEILRAEAELAGMRMTNTNENEIELKTLENHLKVLKEKLAVFRETLKKIGDTRILIELLQAELQRVVQLGNYVRAKEIQLVELAEKKR